MSKVNRHCNPTVILWGMFDTIATSLVAPQQRNDADGQLQRAVSAVKKGTPGLCWFWLHVGCGEKH